MITHSKLGAQGRLGNQLFQYAFLFAQARRTGCSAFIDGDAPGLRLKQYPLDESGTVRVVSHAEYLDLYRREICVCLEEPTFQYVDDLVVPRDACDYSGYFQSERYFRDVAGEVRACFRFNTAGLTSPGRRWQRWIAERQPDVVAVHVRLGDYVDMPAVHTNLHRTHYHQDAIEMIERRLARSCAFLVFSDDIPWCRRHLPVTSAHEVRYAGLDEHTDLYLQTLCTHHVIANSSFSWWGAWLALSPIQQVVAPADWFGSEGPAPHDTVYCDGWTVL